MQPCLKDYEGLLKGLLFKTMTLKKIKSTMTLLISFVYNKKSEYFPFSLCNHTPLGFLRSIFMEQIDGEEIGLLVQSYGS